MAVYDLIAGVGVGLVGGFTSGLLGVSPGGGLVVFSNVLLGSDQHVAQAISLFAQIPPAGLSGIKRYRESGSRAPMTWLITMSFGVVFGGVAGAFAASGVSSSFLHWAYVFYLAVLAGLLINRPPGPRPAGKTSDYLGQIRWAPLLGVGALAGFSSGFLGIGGGLAITAGLSAGLKVPQHQAQFISLIFSILPTTIPSAWVYWRSGWSAPWIVVCAVILGLWAGTDLGARIANRLDAAMLRKTFDRFCVHDDDLHGL